MPPVPCIPGYVEADGWLLQEKVQRELHALSEPTPRSYGWRDQVKVDLSHPASRVLYAVLATLVGASVGAAILWRDALLALAPLPIVWFFGRGFIDGIRVRRHGVTSLVRIGFIEHDLEGVGAGGTNADVPVDSRRMNVGYELAPVRAILALGYDVELKVMYAPHHRKPVAHALAYRAVERRDEPPSGTPPVEF